jgi:alkylhydroperoxidase/carboxymuconolactone decarboxylase family protein YurZ
MTFMDESDRRAQGTAMRRRVLGDAHVDRAIADSTPLTSEFDDLITRYAWGEIWTRPGLDARSRRMIVIATMIALGRWDELEMHVRAALGNGEVKEILLQQTVYCGVPAGRAAFGALRAVIAALDGRG